MKKILLTLTFGFIILPVFAHASTAVIDIDTSNISINTLEATIQIPKNISVTKILDGNSVILFWIKPATFDSTTNTVYFAGLTPGGFAGKQHVLSLVGNFKPSDINGISFTDVTAFKNDGKGTITNIKLSASLGEEITDSTPPDSFSLIISNSEDLFNNNRFLSFSTEDKGTGIDHYEYKDSFVLFGNPDLEGWQTVQSPIELSKTSLFKKLFIKAVDKSGNIRMQSTVGPFYYYLWSLVWVIIVVLVLCVLSYIRKFFK